MNIQNTIEAILFASNKPLAIKRLAHLAKCDQSEVNQALGYLAIRYRDSGIFLKITNGHAQLLTNPEYEEFIKPLISRVTKRKMTSAAIEVLAIVASKGETSCQQISKYRGKPSEMTILGLVKKGLLERIEKPSVTKKRKVSYIVTDKFRQMAGVSGIEEMKAHVTFLTTDEETGEEGLFEEVSLEETLEQATD